MADSSNATKDEGKVYQMEEVAKHNTSESLWCVIHGKAYDLTEWQRDHPGGEDVLLEKAGQDASDEFEDSFHSEEAREQMKKYELGRVEGIPESKSVARELPEYTDEPPKSSFPLSIPQIMFVAVIALIMARLFLTPSTAESS